MTNETEIQPPPPPQDTRQPFSRFALVAFGFALLVALLGVMSGLGARWGLWPFTTGFTLLRYAAYGGIAAAILAAAAVVVARPGGPRRGFVAAFAALVISLIVVGIPWQQQRMARGGNIPPIHDITTDVNNPPAFVAIAPIRADAPNPVEYGGAEVAREQQRAYPDIQPVLLNMPLGRAFQRALDAAQDQGWAIVEANPSQGRIEATDRTFWFGFYDDVVIRLTPVEGRTVLDVRSKSRVGRSDVGANARRIRDYIEDVQE